MKHRMIMVLSVFTPLFMMGCSSAQFALEDPTPSTVLWTGRWESTKYNSVFGDIIVRLPKKLPPETEFKVPVTVEFDKRNSYRPGKVYTAYYKGRLTDNTAKGSANTRQPITPEDAITLGLQPYPSLFNFMESFTLTFNNDMSEAYGVWESSDGDHGIFSLAKSGSLYERAGLRK